MRKKDNQDPASYSKSYFLNECAGAKEFVCGEESEHAIFEYLFEIAGEMNHKTVLDVGCGRGEMVLSALKRGAHNVTGLDFSPDAIEIARNNVENNGDVDRHRANFICGDALNYSFEKKFDFIFLADVVEHLYENQLISLFANLKTALSPGGKIIIHTMPTREFIYIGQYFKWLYCLLRRKPFYRLTFKSQMAQTHVNLQSKNCLAKVLKGSKYSIWYDFADRKLVKKILKKVGLARFLSSNLWAVVRH